MDKMKFIAAALALVGSVALYYFYSDLQQLFRVLMLLVGVGVGVGLLAATAAGRTTWVFFKSANVERQKVVWPTRRETAQVTLFVIILVIVIGIYLWMLDWVSFRVIYDFILQVAS